MRNFVKPDSSREKIFYQYVAALALLALWSLWVMWRCLAADIFCRINAVICGVRKKSLALLAPICIIAILYGPFTSIAAAPSVEAGFVSKTAPPASEINPVRNSRRVVRSPRELFRAGTPAPQKAGRGIISNGINTAQSSPLTSHPAAFRAIITQYSRADSCHTVKNGKCIMASGRPVYVGAAACPYFLKLGTRVIVEGIIYTCEDRYARWLDHARGLPTVDVFVEKNPRGNAVQVVTIKG